MSDLLQDQTNQFDVILSSAPEKTKLEVKNSFAEFLAKADEYSEIIDNLEIKGIDDKAGLDEARKARLFLKNQRGEAKRLTESKRNEIKALKLEYDLADSAWLKTFQFIESVYKPIEEKAEEKEKYVERLKAELVAKLKAERNEKMSQYSDVELPNLELLSDEVFQKMLDNYKMAHEARLKAEAEAEAKRIEDERIEAERRETHMKRLEEIRPWYTYFSDFLKDSLSLTVGDLADMSEEQYQGALQKSKQAKLDHEAEQERVRLENERLKKEAEEKAEADRKQKELVAARTSEMMPYSVYIRDFHGMLAMDEESYKKEFSSVKKGAEEHMEFQRQEQIRKDQEEKDRLKKEAEKQAELDRVQKELAAEKQRQADREAAEKKAEEDRIKAEAELLKSGDKKRLQKWVSDMAIMEIKKEGLSAEGEDLANEISLKFESFKNWAVKQVEKM